MAEIEENFCKLLSSSSSCSWKNRETADETGGEGEEFYEKLEAPKFVDFTVPDHFYPDDGYWFCLRVGCDQKHEEEMDHEAIYMNFVLWVMAARSPNVRLRKALGNSSRTPLNPMSAPPKSSKPRLSIISSISQKMDGEMKRITKPSSKPGLTPMTNDVIRVNRASWVGCSTGSDIKMMKEMSTADLSCPKPEAFLPRKSVMAWTHKMNHMNRHRKGVRRDHSDA